MRLPSLPGFDALYINERGRPSTPFYTFLRDLLNWTVSDLIDYVPDVTALSGDLDPHTLNSAKWTREGDKITVFFDITFSGVGTGATAVVIETPVAPTAANGSVSGLEGDAAGYGLAGTVTPDGIFVVRSDTATFTIPAGTGHHIVGTAIYYV